MRGGFAGVGLGQQANVGQQFQFQPKHGVIALAARLRQHRLLVGGGHEPGVAPAAIAAFCHQNRLPGGDIGQEIFAAVPVQSPHHRAQGHPDLRVRAVGAALVLALAVPPPLQVEGAVVFEVQQGVDRLIADDVCVAAIAAVAAVRPAAGLVLKAQETDAAIAPVSGFYVNSDRVNHKLI